MENILRKCTLCNRNCLVDRYSKLGYCKQNEKIRIAKAAITYFEEPCISGKKGSGTIFFSGCNLGCIFCQNMQISKQNFGKEITIKKLANIMIDLEKKGAANINLVTPTPHVMGIIKSIKIAKKLGLSIPIIYNTSSYENITTLKLLNGYIDVYLPDLKYFDNKYAIKYSKTSNYFEIATKNIQEMVNQVGSCQFNKDGYITKGVIVRHLLLPTLLNDSKKVIKYLYDTYQDNIYLSIMNQYTIMKKYSNSYKELNKSITKKDYNEIIEYAISLGIKNAFCQLDNTNSKKYIPKFDLTGL